MLEHTKRRTKALQARLSDAGIDVALIADPDSIAYYGGFWGYLGVEFGRPTFMVVPKDGDVTVVTPLMESDMASRMTWIEDVRPWEDAGNRQWDAVVAGALGNSKSMTLGIERTKTPVMVSDFLDKEYTKANLVDVAPIIMDMRAIKGAEEIEIMRQAGQVGITMMEAARGALGEGIPEYEAALAVIDGGTRRAADFLTDKGWDAFVSPLIHNLQVMQSGEHTSLVHRRASVKPLERGDPVYFCFCNMVQFKQYKLGFDRQFFITEAAEDAAAVYATTVNAQSAALDSIREGAIAEDVAEAANEVYRSAGFEPGYRTGRSIGMSYLEAPELKQGDRTVLKAGMTFAVDGGITVPGKFGGRIGDSIVVTKDGYEYLTPFPKELAII